MKPPSFLNKDSAWAVSVIEQRSKNGFIHIEIGNNNSLELMETEECLSPPKLSAVPSSFGLNCARKNGRFSLPSLVGFAFFPRIFRKTSKHSFSLLDVGIAGACLIVSSGVKVPSKFVVVFRGSNNSEFNLRCFRVHTQKHLASNGLAVGIRFVDPPQEFKDFVVRSSLRSKVI
jgi:hypothetical protein